MERDSEVALDEPGEIVEVLVEDGPGGTDALAGELDDLLLLPGRVHQARGIARGEAEDDEDERDDPEDDDRHLGRPTEREGDQCWLAPEASMVSAPTVASADPRVPWLGDAGPRRGRQGGGTRRDRMDRG